MALRPGRADGEPSSAGAHPRRYERAFDAMPPQRVADEADVLHLLDEAAQPRLRCGAALRHAHRLLDHHEAAGQQAHAAGPARVGLELLPHAGGDLEVLGQEDIGDGRRGGRAHQLCVFQGPCKVEVVGAGAPDHHAGAGPVDLFVALQGRVVAHEVGAFDDHVGRGVLHVGPAHRIDGHEGEVDLLRLHRFHHAAGRFEGDQLGGHAELLCRLAGQIDRYAHRLAVRATVGEDGVAEIDGRAQCARPAELGERGRTRGRGARAGGEPEGQQRSGHEDAAAGEVHAEECIPAHRTGVRLPDHAAPPPRLHPRDRSLGLVRRQPATGAHHRERRPRHRRDRLGRPGQPAGRRLSRAARALRHPREVPAAAAGAHPHRPDRSARRRAGRRARDPHRRHPFAPGLGLHLHTAPGRRVAQRLRHRRADHHRARSREERRPPAVGHRAAATPLLRRDGHGAAGGLGQHLQHPAACPRRQPRQQGADPRNDALPPGVRRRRPALARRRPRRAGRWRGLYHGRRDGARRHRRDHLAQGPRPGLSARRDADPSHHHGNGPRSRQRCPGGVAPHARLGLPRYRPVAPPGLHADEPGRRRARDPARQRAQGHPRDDAEIGTRLRLGLGWRRWPMPRASTSKGCWEQAGPPLHERARPCPVGGPLRLAVRALPGWGCDGWHVRSQQGVAFASHRFAHPWVEGLRGRCPRAAASVEVGAAVGDRNPAGEQAGEGERGLLWGVRLGQHASQARQHAVPQPARGPAVAAGQAGAGQQAGVVREEGGRFGLAGSEGACRDHVAELRGGVGIATGLGCRDAGLDHAARERVHRRVAATAKAEQAGGRLARVVHAARRPADARTGGQMAEQALDQEPVSEMVHREARLEAIGGELKRARRLHAGIEEHAAEVGGRLALERLRKGGDAGERCEIDERRRDLGCRRMLQGLPNGRGARFAAYRQDEMVAAGFGETQRHLQAQSGGRAGDEVVAHRRRLVRYRGRWNNDDAVLRPAISAAVASRASPTSSMRSSVRRTSGPAMVTTPSVLPRAITGAAIADIAGAKTSLMVA